jgi:hypothetical protein
VLLEDYLVDLLQWDGDAEHEVALPFHGLDLVDEAGRPLARVAAPIAGGDGVEDGFSFLERSARISAHGASVVRAMGTRPGAGLPLQGWILGGPGTTWWSADAPDVPTRSGTVPMLLARQPGQRGSLLSVWSWRDAVAGVTTEGDAVYVRRREGGRDAHAVVTDGWRVDLERSGRRECIVLGGLVAGSAARPSNAEESPAASTEPRTLPAGGPLGEPHYRRSEESWREAGMPSAEVWLSVGDDRLLTVTVTVEPSHRLFVPEHAVNVLDNEPAAINGDGVQLYLACAGAAGAWILVPRAEDDAVSVQPIAEWAHGDGLQPRARWHRTAGGYSMAVQVALPRDCRTLSLDLLINETAPGRVRRRGQLVLSGAEGEFVYLRGDRHDPRRLLRFTMPDA